MAVTRSFFKGVRSLLPSFAKATEKQSISVTTVNQQWGVGSMMDLKKGLRKPSNITFDQLRKLAKFDSIIRICVNVIKKEVSQSEWELVPVKGYKLNQDHVDYISTLFNTVNYNGENIRILMDRILEDVLVLDQGVIELVRNPKNEIVEMHACDGATFRPVLNEFGEVDPDRAYVQVLNEKIVAEFKINDLIWIMQNPQSDVAHWGFGLSNIESILLEVQASLNANMFNTQTFQKDNIPPGMLDLGNMSTEEARAFVAMWNATTINDTQKMKFVWGSDNPKKYTAFTQSNKDMQFVEFIDWLSRIKLSIYGLSSIDANIFQDANRSNSQVQQQITQSRGVLSMKRLLEEYFTREILMPMGIDDIEFKFKQSVDLPDKLLQAQIDQIYLQNFVMNPSVIARREGYDAFDNTIYDNDEQDTLLLQEPDRMRTSPNTPSDTEGLQSEGNAGADVLENTPTGPAASTPAQAANKSSKGTYYRPLYKSLVR